MSPLCSSVPRVPALSRISSLGPPSPMSPLHSPCPSSVPRVPTPSPVSPLCPPCLHPPCPHSNSHPPCPRSVPRVPALSPMSPFHPPCPQACLVSCFQQLMVETCSCGYYLYPLPTGAEHCSSARHPAWGESCPRPPTLPAMSRGSWQASHMPLTPPPGHCFYRLYQDLETHRLPCTSRCPRPCR